MNKTICALKSLIYEIVMTDHKYAYTHYPYPNTHTHTRSRLAQRAVKSKSKAKSLMQDLRVYKTSRPKETNRIKVEKLDKDSKQSVCERRAREKKPKTKNLLALPDPLGGHSIISQVFKLSPQ